MTASSVGLEANGAPRRGRPRRLELGQVLDAALAVGLQQLTMAAVADRLGVAKAVLYSYVSSRDELVELAAAHAARRHRFPKDLGQPWVQWILEYARALFEVMTMKGELLESWMGGGQPPVVEVDAAEMWLRALVNRGFTGEEALQLRRAVAHLVIGAATSMKHDKALRRQNAPRPASARKAVFGRPADETVMLREFTDVFAREVTDQNWEFALYLLLQGVMAGREALQLRNGDSRDMFGE